MLRLIAFLLLVPTLALAQADTQATSAAHSRIVTATPVLDTAAYTSGYLMGGKLTFSNAARPGVGTGYITSIVATDLASQAVAFDLVLFDRNPTSTTFTDQAAFDIADVDLPYVIGVFNFPTTGHFTFADNSVHVVTGQTHAFRTVDSNGENTGTLYGALVARGAYDGASASDIVIKIGISQD